MYRVVLLCYRQGQISRYFVKSKFHYKVHVYETCNEVLSPESPNQEIRDAGLVSTSNNDFLMFCLLYSVLYANLKMASGKLLSFIILQQIHIFSLSSVVKHFLLLQMCLQNTFVLIVKKRIIHFGSSAMNVLRLNSVYR